MKFGKGAFSSIGACQAAVRRQKKGRVPFEKVEKSIDVITHVFNKKDKAKAKLGDECISYAKKLYKK